MPTLKELATVIEKKRARDRRIIEKLVREFGKRKIKSIIKEQADIKRTEEARYHIGGMLTRYDEATLMEILDEACGDEKPRAKIKIKKKGSG